jgi:hypothetical protein
MQTKRFPSFNLPLLAIPCLSRTYEFKQALRPLLREWNLQMEKMYMFVAVTLLQNVPDVCAKQSSDLARGVVALYGISPYRLGAFLLYMVCIASRFRPVLTSTT